MRYLILITLLLMSVFINAKSLKFAMLHKSEAQNVSMCILLEAYKNIGIDVVFHAFPTTRSLKLSNSGEYDGETARILAAKKKYPNLIPIDTPVSLLKGIAFTIKKTAFEPDGFQSLAPYNIIVKYAVLFVEKGVQGLPYVQKVSSYEAAFKMLLLGRSDIVVAPYLNGLAELRKLGVDSIIPLDPPVIEIPLHHFLNKKNSAIVPLINAELASMSQSGRLDEISRDYVRSLTDPAVTPSFNNGDAPTVPCL